MSSRYKHKEETAAANGPVEPRYRGVYKRHGGRYVARVTNPGKRSIWLGTFDTAEEAALAYDSAARQLQGNNANTNFPNLSNLLSPAAALSPEALESCSSGGQAAPLAPEALQLRDPIEPHYNAIVYKRAWGRYAAEIRVPGKKTNIWLGTFDTAEEATLAYDSAARQLQGNKAKTNFPNPNKLLSPAAALPPQASELSLSSYSSGGHSAAGPKFMYHPEVMINNGIHNNVNMSYENETSFGGSSNSSYSVCSSKKLELDLNFPPQ